MNRRRRGVLALALLLLGACSSSTSAGGRTKIVAAFYPLAWAAQRIGGDAVTVADLTPPGAEPHDLHLTANQRNDIQNADLVLIFGRGFQPEVERAARDSRGTVVDLLEGLSLLPSKEEGLGADPHVWLDPENMNQIVRMIERAMPRAAEAASGFGERATALVHELTALHFEYLNALDSCKLKTLVTTHEAFGYVALRYSLTQLGLTGLTPEAEPSAAQIQRVRQMAQRHEVGAVFYEASDEGERIGKSVARDIGVPALPLRTLESNPKPNDYLSQMRANLGNLKKGLTCS